MPPKALQLDSLELLVKDLALESQSTEWVRSREVGERQVTPHLLVLVSIYLQYDGKSNGLEPGKITCQCARIATGKLEDWDVKNNMAV
jgi:hypothetical protein